MNDPTVFGRDCFKPKCATTLFNQRDSADLTLPQVLGSAGSVNVTRTRRAVRGGWETSTPKSAKSRRVVPMMRGWPTICAHFWPTIIRTAARRTPTMTRLRRCFPAATG